MLSREAKSMRVVLKCPARMHSEYRAQRHRGPATVGTEHRRTDEIIFYWMVHWWALAQEFGPLRVS
jgi:hypothetical protein